MIGINLLKKGKKDMNLNYKDIILNDKSMMKRKYIQIKKLHKK